MKLWLPWRPVELVAIKLDARVLEVCAVGEAGLDPHAVPLLGGANKGKGRKGPKPPNPACLLLSQNAFQVILGPNLCCPSPSLHAFHTDPTTPYLHLMETPPQVLVMVRVEGNVVVARNYNLVRVRQYAQPLVEPLNLNLLPDLHARRRGLCEPLPWRHGRCKGLSRTVFARYYW